MRALRSFPVLPILLVLLLSALALACTTEPTPMSPTSTPPAAVDPTTTPEEPTATPVAEDTPTPEATPEPTPTEAPVDPTPTPEPTATPEPTPEPTPAVPAEVSAIADAHPADVLSILLLEENDSGQTGWATLIARGDQTDVILSLPEGETDTADAHIHSGQCGPDLGGVEYPLNSFEGGFGYSVTTVPADLASLRSGDFAINTHNAEDSSIYTSCGNIPTPPRAVTIALNEENDSGQSGVATLTARGAQTDVVLHLSAGELQSEALHIHSGQCGPDLGGVVHPLTSFVGGSGVSATTIDAPLNSLQTGGFAINTHNAEDSSIYTSCGNIGRNANTITIELNEDNDSGQTGVALLTPRDGDTEVWLSLTEGDMESSAAHIHSGQCGPDLGGVEYPLTNLVDGQSGTLVEDVALDSLLTGEFAINTHNADDSSIYTACGDLPAIDVSVIATSYDYDMGELVVPAGQTITMRLANEGENPHNMFFHSYDELNADDEPSDRLQPGQSWTRQLTFDRPGIYTFFCPVGNGSHENRGQIGVLRVVGPDDGEPTLELEAPSTLRELEGPGILFGATVTNFNVDDEGEDAGSLRLTLNDNVLESHPSVVGALTNIPPGEHTITGELLNPNGNPLATPVQSSRTFMVEEGDMPTGNPSLGDSPIADRRTVIVE